MTPPIRFPRALMPVLVAVIAIVSMPADGRAGQLPAAPADKSGAPSSAPADAPVAGAAGFGAMQADGRTLDIDSMRRSVRVMRFDQAAQRLVTTALSASPDAAHLRFRETFDAAKRRDCLTAFQGVGVLALIAMPLATLLDKKDHGCKW